jgi:hypothetical protein
MIVLGYKYQTEQEAQQAISLINKGEGIPVSDDSVTRTYCEFISHEDIYYIQADEVTEKYLGKSTEIEITYPDTYL